MRSLKPAPILFALAFGLALSFTSAPEAHAGTDTIIARGQMWTASNANYTGWMKNIEVVFLTGSGSTVETFTAPDVYVSNGKFNIAFEADFTDWQTAVLNAVTISIESDQVVEEFDYAQDVYLASYYLLEKGTSNTTGGIWNEDHGGAEPQW